MADDGEESNPSTTTIAPTNERNRNGGCASAGEAPCSLWEATLQDHCTATPMPGMGPDFFDVSLVDGFNVNVKATVRALWLLVF